jgi:3-methyladenine DNA glycosylase AlkD
MTPEAIVADIRAEIAALPKRDTPHLRAVRKAWSTRLKAAAAGEVIAAAQALERGAGQGGKWIGYELIRFHAGAFAAIGEAEVEDFASRIASWYATDAFGTVLSGPLWAMGQIGDALVEAWSRSPQMWLRRSALVATVGLNASLPGRQGDAGRTLPICLRLADDREDMIEKAVSWALRYLSQRDRPAVEAFMAEHGDRFAARVRREVRNKLTTGLKTPRLRHP